VLTQQNETGKDLKVYYRDRKTPKGQVVSRDQHASSVSKGAMFYRASQSAQFEVSCEQSRSMYEVS